MNQHNTQDYHSKPFQVMVVMGESTVEGGGWVRNSTERVADILAELINACQETPVRYTTKELVQIQSQPAFQAMRSLPSRALWSAMKLM